MNWLRIKYFFIVAWNLPEAINRRVSVENELYQMAAGDKSLPDRAKCKQPSFYDLTCKALYFARAIEKRITS